MNYVDRNGNETIEESSQDKLLKLLYTTAVGRKIIKILIAPRVSEFGGKFLNTRISKVLIKPFVEKNHIDLNQYTKQQFSSYNDFFMRQINSSQRPVDKRENVLVSPCDAKLSVYKISKNKDFLIKNTYYTVSSLLRDNKLADKYEDGYICIFRLTVDDYHRYCYVDDGKKTSNRRIKGVFHTVNPIANDKRPIYKENTREYSVLKSRHFGDVLMMEVGALMVGKIVNYHQKASVTKGQEKGRFEFGGSTVILMLEKDKVFFDQDIMKNTERKFETIVRQGERIGESL